MSAFAAKAVEMLKEVVVTWLENEHGGLGQKKKKQEKKMNMVGDRKFVTPFILLFEALVWPGMKKFFLLTSATSSHINVGFIS